MSPSATPLARKVASALVGKGPVLVKVRAEAVAALSVLVMKPARHIKIPALSVWPP